MSKKKSKKRRQNNNIQKKQTAPNSNRQNNNRQNSRPQNTAESVEKAESGSEALMDFSKIDDEYKGELRRKLTPKERFFRTCEKFGDLFLLNILFTITSLPVITIGASFTALYSMTFKMVRNEEMAIKDGYFKAFKRNFKQSTRLHNLLIRPTYFAI